MASVRTVPDAGALARAALAEILTRAERALAERGAFHLALAGGSTPRATYVELARATSRARCARWHVWFGDERCVPPEDPASNYGMARAAWLGQGAVPDEHVHRLRGEALDPRAEAARYGAELAAVVPEGRLDLVLLGLGADGHTASLFPGEAALAETSALVSPARAPVAPTERLTLTLPALNAARAVLFLVAGPDKAPALAAALAPAGTVPAARVRPHDGELLWLVDRDAAGTPPGA